MAAKGTIAKQNIINTIKQAFGQNKVIEVDKKLYIWTEENGEPIQIALTLTCPKTFVMSSETSVVIPKEDNSMLMLSFDEDKNSVEISEEEKHNIEDLMKRLNL